MLFNGYQAALGCSSELTLYYVQRVEPYLQDPVAFPKAQVILASFHVVHCLIVTSYVVSLILLHRFF